MNRKFTVIIERAERNFSAYSPDLPGCVATGSTENKTIENMIEAVKFHLEGLRMENQPIPERKTLVTEIQVAA